MTTPTPEQVIQKYLETREKIKEMKKRHEKVLELLETFQSRREDYLLKIEDISLAGFMTDLFINGRNGKAEAKKEQENIGLRQADIEKWLLKMIQKAKLKGIPTEFGTVYRMRKESVTVGDWDALLEAEILRPAAEEVQRQLVVGAANVDLTETIIQAIKSSAHFEILTKGVNKTAVLEIMGDFEGKDEEGGRPNPPPPGVNYTAIATVGVRKGK